jgi:hypothetical protein
VTRSSATVSIARGTPSARRDSARITSARAAVIRRSSAPASRARGTPIARRGRAPITSAATTNCTTLSGCTSSSMSRTID